MAFTIDTEKVKQKIARIRDDIDAETNSQLLNEYRLLLKKEISFFRRPWIAAYLLMLYDQGQMRDPRGARDGQGGPWPSRPKSRAPEGKNSPVREEGPAEGAAYGFGPPGRPSLAEEESRRLFISIGRNRHLFPREILGLIIARAQVAREDIGSIRILDNYSFVQVRDTVADTIITALNGTMFRGRTLAVNYARSKREGADEEYPDTAADAGGIDGAEQAEAGNSPALGEMAPENPAGQPPMEAQDGPDSRPESCLEQTDDHSDKEGV
jgi:hypothetical protein